MTPAEVRQHNANAKCLAKRIALIRGRSEELITADHIRTFGEEFKFPTDSFDIKKVWTRVEVALEVQELLEISLTYKMDCIPGLNSYFPAFIWEFVSVMESPSTRYSLFLKADYKWGIDGGSVIATRINQENQPWQLQYILGNEFNNFTPNLYSILEYNGDGFPGAHKLFQEGTLK